MELAQIEYAIENAPLVDAERAKNIFPRGCMTPGCSCSEGPMFLHAKCHIEAPIQTFYHEGFLYVCCGDCGAPIAKFPIGYSN